MDLVRAAGQIHIEPFTVSPIDTTGAGDAFCGAFACRLALGDEMPHAIHLAAAAGALATTRHGAVPSLPALEETSALAST